MTPKNLYRGLTKGTASSKSGYGYVVIAAGPLTKQPATMPYRHVIAINDCGAYAVYRETFEELGEGKSNFSNGYYFSSGPIGFMEAQKKFSQLIDDHIEYHSTIYRDEICCR